jgi:phospholipid-binding lipoprotein MlaA
LRDQDQSPGQMATVRRFGVAGLAVAAGFLALAPAAHAQDLTPLVPAPPAASSVTTGAYDPLEGANRASFKFSMGVDKALLSPIAHGYVAITPKRGPRSRQFGGL